MDECSDSASETSEDSHLTARSRGEESLDILHHTSEISEQGHGDIRCLERLNEELPIEGHRQVALGKDGGRTSVNVLKFEFHQRGPKVLSIGDTKNAFQTNERRGESVRSPLSTIQLIRNRTLQQIQKHTAYTVLTKGALGVLHKIPKRTSLHIITGRYGDGKRTVCFQVLSQLHKMGRDVFSVIDPQELSYVSLHTSNAVIMVRNICGEFIFDDSVWKSWQAVLYSVMDQNRGGPIVLLVGDNFVLQQWSSQIASLPEADIFITDLTQNGHRTKEEKLTILKALEDKHAVELKEETRSDMCKSDICYSFPKLCSLYLENFTSQTPVQSIFQSPTPLDKHIVKQIMKDVSIRKLLTKLLALKGEINISEVPDTDVRFMFMSTAKDMEGIYLCKIGNCYTFRDRYMYECVAFTLWDIDKRVVIEGCTLSFINNFIRLTQGNTRYHSKRFLLLDQEDEKYLVNRFVKEIESGNLLLVLSHGACRCTAFAQKFMDALVKEHSSMENVASLTDPENKHSSFVYLSTSSRSCEILNIVLQGLKRVPLEVVNDMVFGLCDAASSEALELLTNQGYVLDMDMRNQNYQTPAMVAAGSKNDDFMTKLLSFEFDVKALDSSGRSLLHYVCENGLILSTKFVLDRGEDINIKDNGGRTPLQDACEWKHLPVVELLTERGVVIDTMSLHDACKTGELNMIRMMIERGGDVHCLTETGETLLHSACDGTTHVVNFLLRKGVPLNKPDYCGRTPLDKAQIVKNFRVEQYLKMKGARYGLAPISTKHC